MTDTMHRPRLAWLLPIVALAIVFFYVHLPYFVISPGGAEDVEPRIHVRNRTTYQSEGHLLLTDVYLSRPNLYEALGAWLDPREDVVPEHDIFTPGLSREQQTQVSLSQMDQSKIDAAVVALTRYAGYPKQHRPGALVEQVFADTPADGNLFSGDLIVQANGQSLVNGAQLGPIIRSTGAGGELTLQVRAGGKERTVVLSPVMVKGIDHPIIGVFALNNFPFPLSISSGDIGGPSAGLMWTLGLIDVLTPGDLTGGAKIAGTGEIGVRGRVGPIGGVRQKVVAAERAGATVFLVPVDNAAEARSVATTITIVPVRTYIQALDYLLAHGGAVS
jgi:Lon-like protease